MKKTLAILCISRILVWFCCAEQYGAPVATNATVSENATSGIPKADPAAYYATLNRRVVESTAQFELLNQMTQEHRKRAEEAPPDQGARSQWESELAKELGERAAAILTLLTNTTRERVAFEQSHPDLATSTLANSPAGATNGPNAAETAFLAKLAERRTAVQQEIAATTEAAMLYAIQLGTNSSSYDSSRVSSLLQENGYYLKQLQKELFDLDLKNLEFRALSRH